MCGSQVLHGFDFQQGAQAIESVSPDPKLRTWQGASEPGTVVALSADHVVIATGEGLLSLHELQKPGGKRLAIKDFLGGWPMQLGQTFE